MATILRSVFFVAKMDGEIDTQLFAAMMMVGVEQKVDCITMKWKPLRLGIGGSQMIEIVFNNGDMAHYEPSEYTDYKYDGKYFIVIYEKQWIGFYNLDCVEYIVVERTKQ